MRYIHAWRDAVSRDFEKTNESLKNTKSKTEEGKYE